MKIPIQRRELLATGCILLSGCAALEEDGNPVESNTISTTIPASETERPGTVEQREANDFESVTHHVLIGGTRWSLDTLPVGAHLQVQTTAKNSQSDTKVGFQYSINDDIIDQITSEVQSGSGFDAKSTVYAVQDTDSVEVEVNGTTVAKFDVSQPSNIWTKKGFNDMNQSANYYAMSLGGSPSIGWRYQIPGYHQNPNKGPEFRTDPAISQGKVFIASESGDNADTNGMLISIDSQTGSELWRKGLDFAPINEIALAGQNIYLTAATASKTVLQCHSFDGDLNWQTEISGDQNFQPDVSGCPLIIGDRVYVNSVNGIKCLSAESGDFIWEHNTGVGTTGQVVADTDRLYRITFKDESFLVNSYSKNTGEKMWTKSFDIADGVVNSPVVGENYVFVVTGVKGGFGGSQDTPVNNHHIFAIHKSTNEVIKSELPEGLTSSAGPYESPAMGQYFLFIPWGDAIIGVSKPDQDRFNEQLVPRGRTYSAGVYNSPALAVNSLYVISGGGTLKSLRTDWLASEKWTFSALENDEYNFYYPWSGIVTYDSKIYVNSNRYVFSIDTT